MRKSAAAVLIPFLVLAGCSRRDEPLGAETGAPPPAAARALDSADLKDTVVVPTIDTPMPDGKTVVWCAAFNLAWKELEKLALEPIAIENAPEAVGRLNDAPNPRHELPPSSFYARAGLVKEGVVEKLREEIAAQFPGHTLPDLSARGEAAAVAYAFLRAGVKFATPYPQKSTGVLFRGASGNGVMSGFGFEGGEPRDEAQRKAVRGQLRILFYDGPESFAIDPGVETRPYQIVLARLGRPSSLAVGIYRLAEKERGAHGAGTLEENDSLLVPDMDFQLDHRFEDLEGDEKTIKNRRLAGLFLAVAGESIRFKLDRSGAKLESEAQAEVNEGKRDRRPYARRLEFTGPFLLLVRKRGSTRPVLAIWVESLELLEPHSGASE